MERPRRPLMPGSMLFESVEGGPDPAVLREAAERCAVALVRGAGDPTAGSQAISDDLVARVVALADNEGLETLADLWSGSPADSLAGSLWRLYLLRCWVYAAPAEASREFTDGRAAMPVAEAVAGVADPPGPEEVRRLVDEVLAGIVHGEYADVLFRAAAFARVVAVGRAHAHAGTRSTYDSDLTASRLLALSEQLEHTGHLELHGQLG